MPVVDKQFETRRAIRGKLGQKGVLATSGLEFRPLAAKFRLYEQMARQDTTLKTALRTFVHSIVSTIGEVTHQDPEINEYLIYTLKALEDDIGKSWRDILSEIQFTIFWSGFQVSEKIFDLKFGSLVLADLITYHPSTIIIRADKQGRLTEGKETRNYKKSGIYQQPLNYAGDDEIPLPLWKVVYHANEAEYGNYFGRSILAPAYKAYRLKEAVTDMMIGSLDTMGRRRHWIRSPSYPTGQHRVDPATGQEIPLTTLDLIREQLDSSEGGDEFILLPYVDAASIPELGSEPIGDNIGDIFLQTINFLDQEAVREILPHFLISDRSLQLDKDIAERRMEIYYNSLEHHRQKLLRPIVKSVLQPLVEWNFNRSSAKYPPSFTRVYSDRPEDRVATMQMVKGLTENGYLNPTNSVDWQMVRQMVRIAERTLDDKDKKFINDMLIVPRQKSPSSPDVARNSQGSGREGRPTGDVTPQIKARDR